jgi:hypothetical protein
MIRLSCNLQGLAADIVPMQYAIPDLLGRFGIPEQFAIFLIYDAFVDQEIQIDGLAPVALAYQDDRDRLDLARLYEREHFEYVI